MTAKRNLTRRACRSGIGLMSALGILFIGLKLTGHIDWSWWWVTAPLWGDIAIVLAICVVLAVFAVICTGIAGIAEGIERRKDRNG
jgi:hypothetical protein